MTIRDSLLFSYAGRRSDEMGLINVNLNNGLLEEAFLPERQILETKIRGRDEPYFNGISYSPLQFQLSFAFLDTWNDDKIREVARWLSQEYYQPLFFTSNINRIFYCMPIESPSLIHNAVQSGYITLTFRCNSPYTYSPVYKRIFDFTSNTASGSDVEIDNIGDLPCKPKIYVKVISGTTFKIVNLSNGGEKLEFTGLANNETVTIDCDREEIETDIPLTYRFGNMTSDSNFLKLPYGVNRLKVYGNVQIAFEYQFKTLQ